MKNLLYDAFKLVTVDENFLFEIVKDISKNSRHPYVPNLAHVTQISHTSALKYFDYDIKQIFYDMLD